MENEIKIDLGCGRMKGDGFIGVDIIQLFDGHNKEMVDVVLDIEKDAWPWADDSVTEIRAYSVLEHLDDLKRVLNECWRVLKPGAVLRGSVPICGTHSHWKDPTHKRCFVNATFDYFTGKSDWNPGAPGHPRYAYYGFKAWDMVEISDDGEIIQFVMKPQK